MIPLIDVVGDWDKFLDTILVTDEIVNNLNYINQQYRKHENNLVYPEIYPAQENVFKAFQECSYHKMSVIVLLQDPYPDGRATGLAAANPNDGKLSPSLQVIKDTILHKVYNGDESAMQFDPTLIKWAKQGVLMLNTALTVEKNKSLSHSQLWTLFTTKFLQKMNEVNSGIVYCLWGQYAKSYKAFINANSNTILECTHPVYAAYRNKNWDCNHFTEINNYLKKFNNTYIIW